MARFWQCGFELNSTTGGIEAISITTGSTIVTTTVRSGTYALRQSPSTNVTQARFRFLSAANNSTSVFVRTYLNVSVLPTSGSTVFRVLNNVSAQCGAIFLTSGGALQLQNAAAAQVGSNSSILDLNRWYCIELNMDASVNPGTVTGRLEGVQFATGANSAQSPWSIFSFGNVTGNDTYTWFQDDMAANDTTTGGNNSWCGQGKIIHLRPNADGDSHQWLQKGGGAGSSTNYQNVNEVTPNDATTYNMSKVANDIDLYNCDDSGISPESIVNAVLVGTRQAEDSSTTARTFAPIIIKTSGGTQAQGTTLNTTNSTTYSTFTDQKAGGGLQVYPLSTYQDPDGAPWTQATLDTMQIGVKTITGGATSSNIITTIWASVDYTPYQAPMKSLLGVNI